MEWLDDDRKMTELGQFSDREAPCLVWQGDAAYENIFTFLAIRFLLSEDSVGACERIHARWKWILGHRRALRFRTLNSVLRITHYLEQNGSRFPDDRILANHFRDIRAGMAARLQGMRAGGEVDPRLGRDF